MTHDTNNDLIKSAYTQTHAAANIMKSIWNRGQAHGAEILELVQALRLASAAALELENRIVRGLKPPKTGE